MQMITPRLGWVMGHGVYGNGQEVCEPPAVSPRQLALAYGGKPEAMACRLAVVRAWFLAPVTG